MELVFISGQGRSGTTLLKDLFDNHPQVAVWPNEWQYLTNYSKFVSKDSNEKINVKNIINLLNNDRKFNTVYENNIFDHRDFKREKKYSSQNPNFKSLLHENDNEELDVKEFYNIIANAYKWKSTQKIFCNKCNDPENIIDYISHFRKAKFIFMIRNPLNSFISKLKHRAKGYQLVSESYPHSIPLISFIEIKSFFKILKMVLELKDLFKNIFILKLEDFIKNKTECLNKIMHFLNIDYSDTLNDLTFFGDQVNGYFVDVIAGSNKVITKKKVLHDIKLTENEKKWFDCYSNLFIKFYPDFNDKLNMIKPVKLFDRSFEYFKKYQNVSKKMVKKYYSKLLMLEP